MRTKLMATIPLVAALLASSAVTPVPLMAQSSNRLSHQAFCRSPERLPNLGPERIADQGQSGPVLRGSTRVAEAMPSPPPPPPPPPPPAPMSTGDSDGGDRSEERIVVTASRVPGTGDAAPEAARRVDDAVIGRAASPSGSVSPRDRRQVPQAGILTAGEHDDLLNPELYARYVRRSNLGQAIPDVPVLDTSRLLTVTVRDNAGRPVPFADVVLTCADGNAITLATQGDGKVVFFPAVDRLSPQVSIRVRQDGRWQGGARQVAISDAAGGQDVTINTVTGARSPDKLDLMLVIDTTGSMGDEIRYLQSELRSIVSAIHSQHRGMDIRVGFVFYRDTGDAYVTRTIAFDRDMARIDGTLAQQNAQGGGDYPEAMDQALIRAMDQSWRPDAIKSMLLVADAPPHDNLFRRTWNAAEVARHRRVHIIPVAASGVADRAEYAMRGMAALTQSRYLFLTDDSGVGNPHAAPAIDCYFVTRLDALIRRVIASQISGRRIEPAQDDIIRSVGQQDAGRCILPADFGKEEPAQ